MADHLSVFEAMAKVTADVRAIGKDSKNPEFGYTYRGVDDVIEGLHSHFAEAELLVVPVVVGHEERSYQVRSGSVWWYTRLTVEYHFFGAGGDELPVPVKVIGEGSDALDKGVAKAMSAAYKTAMSQTFSIPFDAPDSEADHTQAEVPLWRELGWANPETHLEADRMLRDAVARLEGDARRTLVSALHEAGVTGPSTLKPSTFATMCEIVTDLETPPDGENEVEDSESES